MPPQNWPSPALVREELMEEVEDCMDDEDDLLLNELMEELIPEKLACEELKPADVDASEESVLEKLSDEFASVSNVNPLTRKLSFWSFVTRPRPRSVRVPSV